MKKFIVKPGYHEWNIFLNDTLLWNDGDPTEFLFGEEPYSIEAYVDLCIDSIKEIMEEEPSYLSFNIESLKKLTASDFDKIKQEYIGSLKKYYGIK